MLAEITTYRCGSTNNLQVDLHNLAPLHFHPLWRVLWLQRIAVEHKTHSARTRSRRIGRAR